MAPSSILRPSCITRHGYGTVRIPHTGRDCWAWIFFVARLADPAMEPEAVIMDEPTVALDPYNRRIVMNAIRAMQNTRVIASHDLDMILDLCDRVILISGGRIAADDTSETILYDKELLEKNRLELPLRLSR